MSDTASVLISAENIQLQYEQKIILRDVSLSIHTGEIISLVGPNGAGKTTLIRILLGLQPILQGKVWRQPKLRLAYLPQKLTLDNTLPLTVARFLSLTAPCSPTAVTAALTEMEIAELAHIPLQAISGGELQRVMLARCLLRRPELLVLDEPDQGMDLSAQQQLYRLITDIRDRYQCGVLMVSHNLHLVMASTHQVICLQQHICCHGHPESIAQHPEFVRLFGRPMPELAIYTHEHDHRHDLHGDVVDD